MRIGKVKVGEDWRVFHTSATRVLEGTVAHTIYGLEAVGTHLWELGTSGLRIYDLADEMMLVGGAGVGSRLQYRTPSALTVDDANFWISSPFGGASGVPPTGNGIFRFTIPDQIDSLGDAINSAGATVQRRDLPTGVWCSGLTVDDGHVYALGGGTSRHVYVYDDSDSMLRVSAREFDLPDAITDPTAITADDSTFWVLAGDGVFGLSKSDKSRDVSKDFSLGALGAGTSAGMTIYGDNILVGRGRDIYQFPKP